MGVEITGTALETFRRLKASRPALLRALQRAAQLVTRSAKANVRRVLNTTGEATGNLARSITMDVDDAGLEAEVGPRRVVYAAIHEYGGVIRPVRARALMFQVGGQWVTARSVTIPARPYLHPALDENQARIEQEFDNAVEGLV